MAWDSKRLALRTFDRSLGIPRSSAWQGHPPALPTQGLLQSPTQHPLGEVVQLLVVLGLRGRGRLRPGATDMLVGAPGGQDLPRHRVHELAGPRLGRARGRRGEKLQRREGTQCTHVFQSLDDAPVDPGRTLGEDAHESFESASDAERERVAYGPLLVVVGMAEFDQIRGGVDQLWGEFHTIWPELHQDTIAWIRPSLAQPRRHSQRLRPNMSPSFAKLLCGPISRKLGRNCPEFDQLGAMPTGAA